MTAHGPRIAYLAAGLNALAGLAMLAIIRGGAPQTEPALADRLAYVHAHATSWRLAWLTWNAAALALLAFYVVLANRWRPDAPVLCRLAVLAAAAGLAADLGAETMLAAISPSADAQTFALIERIAYPLTGYLGNGLYTVAGIMLTVAGARALPRALLAGASVVWAFGIALSASALVASDEGQFVATAGLMPAFVLWTVAVGRWLRAS